MAVYNKVAGSREALLEAADGDPTQFVLRVQSVVDTWDERIRRATPA